SRDGTPGLTCDRRRLILGSWSIARRTLTWSRLDRALRRFKLVNHELLPLRCHSRSAGYGVCLRRVPYAPVYVPLKCLLSNILSQAVERFKTRPRNALHMAFVVCECLTRASPFL